jgi:hypothetical protein
MRRGRLRTFLIVSLILAASIGAQELPGKIRGYSVYKADIIVSQQLPTAGGPVSDAVVSLSDPTLKELSAAGATLQVSAEFKAVKQSGQVDFLAFHDLRVNGIPVDVDEYRESFKFTKGETVKLPAPATIFIPTTQILRAALHEANRSDKVWTITGRVFVFGKFRKYGLEHKRVVPIDINFKIANPLLSDPRLER